VLGGAALGIFPGLWLYSVYAYPYHYPYHYYNSNAHKNETYNVICLCEEYAECGCENNNNSTYYDSLFNGTEPKNSSVVRVVQEKNGTETIYINGTLANGTTAADSSSSSSSSSSPNSSSTSGASGSLVTALHATGFWVPVALVVTAVWGVGF
jgi:hypothetical protein